ncbi:MAG: DUF2934 domain-containing protein [Alphaproteobacteria bacterium]|nr:DUF2934 domain-containing protein [Alphaproteobacteria bacterium]
MSPDKKSERREQRITELAHQYWEAEGKPEGMAETHWLRAVAVVDAESVRAKTKAKAAKKAPAKKTAQAKT